MEEFQLNTKIVSGPGAIGVLGQEKARRVFLVTDPFFVKKRHGRPGGPGRRCGKLGDF